MSDIFISYARADRPKAQILANALEQQGWSVWWDVNVRIGGKFDQVIKKELDAAKCVIALWSSKSIESEWVKDEAAEAVKCGILVPAFIEDVEIPFGFGFRRIQAAWLVDWQGVIDHPEFVRLLNDLSALIGKPPPEIAITQRRSSEAPIRVQTNEQGADGAPQQEVARSKQPPIRTASSFESAVNLIRKSKSSTVAILAAIVSVGIVFTIYRPGTDSGSAVEPRIMSDKPEAGTRRKLYSEMTEAEQLDFVRQQARHISDILGEHSASISDKAVFTIKGFVDGYAARANSLSDEIRKEGLRSVFGRASQYAPVIIRSFKARGIHPIIGLYIPMIESEYRSCLKTDVGTGMYMFIPKTARTYGMSNTDLCDIEKVAPAAAEHIADRTAEFGPDSMTLVILSFYRGPDSIRRDLRSLRRNRPNIERSFWSLFDNADLFDRYFQEDAIHYVPKFFAATMVGENPETFGLPLPPLSMSS